MISGPGLCHLKARLFSVGAMVRIDWLLMMAQPSNHQHAYPAARRPDHLLRRVLTRLLCVLLALQPMLAQAVPVLAPPATLQAGGHLSLLAPKLDARGDITLKAERGRVYLGAGKDTDYIHEDYSKTGWFKWAVGERGLGAAAGGGCEAGAIGGVAGEAVGDWLRADMETRLREGTVRGEDLQRWVDRGVSLARLAGGVGAWLAAGEAGAFWGGADTAANAARHNALFLIPVIWGMLELADKALTVRDAYRLARAMRAGDEERAAELATEIGIGLALEQLPGNKIVQNVLGIFSNKGAKVAAKVENNIGAAEETGRIGKTAEGGSAGAMRRLECQASPKHKSSARNTSKGVASRGPTDGQHALDNSIQVKSTSTRRIGVDKANGEIVVFDQTSDGIFHGHVRAFKNLTSAQQNALRNAGLVDKKGNF